MKEFLFNHLTDVIVFIVILFGLARGWSQGFLRTIWGPLALAGASVLSVIYYQKTANLPVALLIGILGPWVIQLAGSFLLNIWNRTVDRGSEPNLLSRSLGSGLSGMWSTAVVIMIAVFLTLIPLQFSWVKTIQSNIEGSLSYRALNLWTNNILIAKKNEVEHLADVLRSPKVTKIAQTKEYQNLMNNPKVKDLLADKQVASDIEQKNISNLASNPKVHTVLNDPELIEKLSALHKKILTIDRRSDTKLSSQE